jgi:DNA-directed RNA polymerase subunit RPC12/RpoP
MIGDIDADETGYRCLNCGHKFYVWTKRNENKLEVHYAVDVKKP